MNWKTAAAIAVAVALLAWVAWTYGQCAARGGVWVRTLTRAMCVDPAGLREIPATPQSGA